MFWSSSSRRRCNSRGSRVTGHVVGDADVALVYFHKASFLFGRIIKMCFPLSFKMFLLLTLLLLFLLYYLYFFIICTSLLFVLLRYYLYFLLRYLYFFTSLFSSLYFIPLLYFISLYFTLFLFTFLYFLPLPAPNDNRHAERPAGSCKQQRRRHRRH